MYDEFEGHPLRKDYPIDRTQPLIEYRQVGSAKLTPFGGEKKKVLELLHKMFELGVIAFYCGHGPYHVRFLPPVGVMEPDQMDEVFSIVRKSMEDVACS